MPSGTYKRTTKQLNKLKEHMLNVRTSKFGFQKGHTLNSEEKSYHWRGEEVGYKGVHIWVRKWKGKPKLCEVCGLDDSKRIYHWANIDHTYKRVLEDYISMCVSCHRKFDMKNNNYQLGFNKQK